MALIEWITCGIEIPLPASLTCSTSRCLNGGDLLVGRSRGRLTNTYHLVMTNIAMENQHPFLMGKSTISMGHLYHGYVK